MGQALDEFRAAAAECMEAARRTTDTEAAATLLSMAQKWIALADAKTTADARLRDQLMEFNRQQMFGETKKE
jgi:hypothetical protein